MEPTLLSRVTIQHVEDSVEEKTLGEVVFTSSKMGNFILIAESAADKSVVWCCIHAYSGDTLRERPAPSVVCYLESKLHNAFLKVEEELKRTKEAAVKTAKYPDDLKCCEESEFIFLRPMFGIALRPMASKRGIEVTKPASDW